MPAATRRIWDRQSEPPRARDLPLVVVEWEDATRHPSGWRAIDDLQAEDGLSSVTSVGWLLHESEAFVSLVSSISTDPDGGEHGCNGLTIPRENVRRMTRLQSNSRRRR